MEVIGGFVFFSQGRKLISLELETGKTRSHLLHQDEITSITQSNGLIVTSSLDGTIVKWSLPDAEIYKVGSPVQSICASHSEVYYLKSSSFVLFKIDLASQTFSQTPYFKGMLEDAVDLKMTFDNKRIALLKRYSVVILKLDTEESRIFESSVPLNILQVHPSSEYVAVGDYTGQIIKIYENYITKVHWHAHRVQCIGFTNDSNFMLSGGEEGVVVIWHEGSTEKSFLPRLGSAVVNVQVNDDNNLYIVRLADGGLKVFRTADHKQISGYTCLINPGKIIPGGTLHKCVYIEGTGIVLNGAPGHLQFYDPVSRDLKVFDCENRNPILRSNEDYPYPYTILSFTFSNNTLCTLQSSSSPFLKIQKLKFWKEKTLTSLVLHPHSDTCHSLISFKSRVISLGSDSFAIYLESDKGWTQAAERWFNALKPSSACSLDSLYVSFECAITEWDEHLNLISTFYEPSGQKIIEMIASNDYLIVSTHENIHLFSNEIIERTIDLAYIHHISVSNNYLLVSLNGSAYAPIETRQKESNVLIKFDLGTLKPVKLYKTEHPLWTGLDHEGNTLQISKLFELQNLDKDFLCENDVLPRYQKTVDEESKVVTQKITHLYHQNKGFWLDSHASHDLPEADFFFSQIVLNK